jgi:hypothetical protein
LTQFGAKGNKGVIANQAALRGGLFFQKQKHGMPFKVISFIALGRNGFCFFTM